MKDPGDVLRGDTQQDLSPVTRSPRWGHFRSSYRKLKPNFPIFILPSASFPPSPAQYQLLWAASQPPATLPPFLPKPWVELFL